MGEFLVELYLPREIAGEAAGAADWGRSAAEQAISAGTQVRHLQTILVPADETCFLLYEATCAEDALEAAKRSKLRVTRVNEALLGGDPPRPGRRGNREDT